MIPAPSMLMCPPDYYGVRYEINPWMSRTVTVDDTRARDQWQGLYRILKDELGCTIRLIEPLKGLPDMVFTANAGYVADKRFIPSRFRYAERRGEEKPFRRWFQAHGFQIVDLPPGGCFEGFGDALSYGGTIFAGYRFRSDIGTHGKLGELLGQRVLSLELTDPRFYHLDTCFCPLEKDHLLYYPGGFDDYGRRAIAGTVEAGRLIPVKLDDALTFCCNAVSVGDAVVMNTGAPDTVRILSDRGYRVYETPLSEFLKAGGAAKCLTLRLA